MRGSVVQYTTHSINVRYYFTQASPSSLMSVIRAGPIPFIRSRSSTELNGLRSIRDCARSGPIWIILCTSSREALLISIQWLVVVVSFLACFSLPVFSFEFVDSVLLGLIVPSSLVVIVYSFPSVVTILVP